MQETLKTLTISVILSELIPTQIWTDSTANSILSPFVWNAQHKDLENKINFIFSFPRW